MLKNPLFGWVSLVLHNDNTNIDTNTKEIQFNISYLCDPVCSFLKIFIEMNKNYNKDKTKYQTQGISICLDGEAYDIYLSFFEDYTIVTIEKEEYETSIIFKGYKELSNELIDDLENNDFLKKYCDCWYEKNKVQHEEKIKKLMKKLKSILITNYLCE